MHDLRFPHETDGYRLARNQLLAAEAELRRQTERVAELRRKLPLGGEVTEDYLFVEGGPALDDRTTKRSVRLSELFGDKDTLVLYNFMYGPDMERPCPMCTSFLDGLHGNARHIQKRVALAVVARSPIERIREFARERGWQRMRVLSSADNTFNRDYHGDDAKGAANPMLHIFVKRGGKIHHFWSSELQMVETEPGQNQRHLDTMWPLWNVLDMTPGGRGDWYPALSD
jgi:predicted dithiol-disulfide oxidoreductase (DUF899 family)